MLVSISISLRNFLEIDELRQVGGHWSGFQILAAFGLS